MSVAIQSDLRLIMSSDDNLKVRRVKRQTLIETWWRRGGLSDDQYRALDALACDFEARLTHRSGRLARVGNGEDYMLMPGSQRVADHAWSEAECDRRARLVEARAAISSAVGLRAWPLLELVLCDVGLTRIDSLAAAAKQFRMRHSEARRLLRVCADALAAVPSVRRRAQRVSIWAARD